MCPYTAGSRSAAEPGVRVGRQRFQTSAAAHYGLDGSWSRAVPRLMSRR